MPPGPPGKFIIGNLLDVPHDNAWETFGKWKEIYGDVVHLNILGEHLIILNSFEAAWELLEKRSSIYSDRNDFTMLIDLMKNDWNIAFMRYGDRWRLHRKIFHQEFHSGAVSSFHGVELKYARGLLTQLQANPKAFVPHLMHMSSAIIMEAMYGLAILRENDPLVALAEEAIDGIVQAATPGKFLVDTFPTLKYVPEWFPGATFQKKARQWRVPILAMVEKPYQAAKHIYVSV